MSDYAASNITVLNDLEAVRLRPGMYIGNTGKEGLHRCLGEVLDNSVDEFMAEHADNILLSVGLEKSENGDKHWALVADNGRGIPVDIHPETGRPTVETIFTVLHAGGKFDQKNYQFSGGLHGVGASVANFLSEKLEVWVLRGGIVHYIRFEKGVPIGEMLSLPQSEMMTLFPELKYQNVWQKTGTIVKFLADSTIFEVAKFDLEEIYEDLKNKAYLNKKLQITFIDHTKTLKPEKLGNENSKFDKKSKGDKSSENSSQNTEEVENSVNSNNSNENSDSFIHRNSENQNPNQNPNQNLNQMQNPEENSAKNSSLVQSNPNYNLFKFYYPQGILTYLEDVCDGEVLISPIIHIEGGLDNFRLEMTLTYSQNYNEKVYAFTNGVANPEGGTHITGFKTALTRILNTYAMTKNFIKKETEKFTAEDLKEGQRVILSLKMTDPQFTSQSKVKLGSTIARTMTDKIFSDKFSEFLEDNPSVGQSIVQKAQLAMKARLAAKAARENVMRKGVLESTSLPGKLADCASKDPTNSEIYIVEGDSAGGSAKQGRDRHTQAILPLRGKVLNTEKATLDRILNYEGIKNMVIAFGTGIGDRFDIEKLRYHKIILMTDADVDGAHITTLLLTFLYRYMPQLIEDGYVYMARPPLFRIQWGKKVEYVYSDVEKFALLTKINKDQNLKLENSAKSALEIADKTARQNNSQNPTLENEGNNLETNLEITNSAEIALTENQKLENSKNSDLTTENSKNSENANLTLLSGKTIKIEIQRYKGLGEMNPEQLWDTTMDPATRLLYQVTIGEAKLADEVFDRLMGSEVAPRKAFIEENARFVEIDSV